MGSEKMGRKDDTQEEEIQTVNKGEDADIGAEKQEDELELDQKKRFKPIEKKSNWFANIVLYFVNKKNIKLRRGQRSLISRNQNRIKHFSGSFRNMIRERTNSMRSIASTNFRIRSRHSSKIDNGETEERINDRILKTNLEHALKNLGEDSGAARMRARTHSRSRHASKLDYVEEETNVKNDTITKTNLEEPVRTASMNME